MRLQKSLEDSDSLVSKYQKQNQVHNESYKEMLTAVTQISNITMKVFTIEENNSNPAAVEELCNIEKCKEYLSEIQKIPCEDIGPFFKTIKKLIDMYTNVLGKKREVRLSLMKKDAQLKKLSEEDGNSHEKMKQESS